MRKMIPVVAGLLMMFLTMATADDAKTQTQTQAQKLPSVVASEIMNAEFTASVTEIGVVKAEESVSLVSRIKALSSKSISKRANS